MTKVSSTINDPKKYFNFTLVDHHKKKQKIDAKNLDKEPKIGLIVKDALRHLDPSRGKNVMITLSDDQDSYTLKHHKTIEHHVVDEEIHPLDLFFHRKVEKSAKGEADHCLNQFFTLLSHAFSQLHSFVNRISGQEQRQLKFNITLLQELNHSVVDKGLSRSECLVYLIATLKQERESLPEDKKLIQRLEVLLDNSQQIEVLRKKYAKKGRLLEDEDFNHVVKSFKDQILSLQNNDEESKLLLPVGYTEEGRDEELFVEISKHNDTFTLHLVSQSDKEAKHFHRGIKENEIVTRSLRYEIENISQDDLLSKISTLVEFQVNPLFRDKKSSHDDTNLATSPQKNFYKLLKFDDKATLIETPIEEQQPATRHQGNLKTLISFVHSHKPKSKETYHDLALRLNAFLEVTEKSDQWLKNHTYREVVLHSCSTLIDHIEQSREELFGEDTTVQAGKIDLILHRIDAVREKASKILPDSPSISQIKLSSFKSDPFTLSPSKECPELAFAGLTANPFNYEITLLDPSHLVDSIQQCQRKIDDLQTKKASSFELEVGLFSRTIIHHTDSLLSLTDDELNTASSSLAHITKVYQGHIADRRRNSIWKDFLANGLGLNKYKTSDKTDVKESSNVVALLIVSALLAQEKIDRDAHKGLLDQDTLLAPLRALSVAKWSIGIMQHSCRAQPLDLGKGNIIVPSLREFLDFCETLTEPNISPKDVNLDFLIIPKTKNTHLQQALNTFQEATLPPRLLAQAHKQELNADKLAFDIKSSYQEQITFIRKANTLIDERVLLSFSIATKVSIPSPPPGFTLKDHYHEYTDDELYYLDCVNKTARELQVKLLIEKFRIFAKLTPAQKAWQTKVDQLKKPTISYLDFIFHKSILTIFEFPPVAKTNLTESTQQFLNKDFSKSSWFFNLSSTTPSFWAAKPHEILPGFAKKYSKEILQDLFCAKIFDEESPSLPAEKAENLLLCFAKHPELFEAGEMQNLLEYTLFLTKSNVQPSHTNVTNFLFSFKEEKSQFAHLVEENNFDVLIEGISDSFLRAIKLNQDANKQEVASYIIHFMKSLKERTPLEKQDAFDTFFSRDDILMSAMDLQLNLLKEVTENQPEGYQSKKNEIAARALGQVYKEVYTSSNPEILLNESYLCKIVMLLAHYEESGGSVGLRDAAASERINEIKTICYAKMHPLLKKDDSIAKNLVINTLDSLMPDFDKRLIKVSLSVSGFPIFNISKNGFTYHFDIERGILYKGGIHSEILPNCLRSNKQVINLFGDSLGLPWTKQTSKNPLPYTHLSVYTHPTDSSLRILLKHSLNDQNHATNASPKIRIERYSNNRWLTFHRYEAQDDVSATDLPNEVVNAICNRDCWISRDGKTIEVWEANDLFATINLRKHKNDTTGKVISFVRVDGKKMLSVSPALHERLGAISQAHEITVYGKNSRPSHIEYHQIILTSTGNTLTYTAKKDDLVCDAFPGYKLAPLGVKVPLDALPRGFSSYHLLEKEGLKKVIIPFDELQPSKLTGFTARAEDKATRNEAYSQYDFIPSIQTKKAFEFTLNTETQKLEIHKPEGDAYLYLAYIAYVNHDYKLATFYLEKSHSNLTELGSYEPIFNMIEKVRDRSHAAQAFLLKVAISKEKMVMKEEQKAKIEGVLFPDPLKNSRLLNLQNLYKNYLQAKKSHVATLDKDFELSAAQENFVKKRIPSAISSPASHKVEPLPQQPAPKIPLPLLPLATPEILWTILPQTTRISHLEDQKWMTNHFFEIVNKIISLDKDSSDFKELSTKMRASLMDMQAENLLGEISGLDSSENEKSDFDKDAPVTLLPLIKKTSLRKKLKSFLKNGRITTDAMSISLLVNLLDHKEAGHLEHITPLAPPKRSSSLMIRVVKIFRLNIFASTLNIGYNPLQPGGYLYPTSIETLIDNIERKNKVKTLLFRGTLKKIRNELYSGNYPSVLSPAKLKELIRKVTLGKDEATYLAKIDELIETLQSAPSIDPAIPHASSNKDKEDHSFTVDRTSNEVESDASDDESQDILVPDKTTIIQEIAFLESKMNINSGTPEELKPQKKVITPANRVTHLLSKNVDDWKKDFKISVPEKAEPLDTSVFKTMDSDVQFLIDEHKEGLKTYLDKIHDDKTYLISQSKILKQQEQLAEIEQKLVSQRDELKEKIALLTEHFDTPVALMKLKRETGQATKPQLEDFITIWRRGEFTTDWDQNPLKKLGISKIDKRELEDFDSTLQEYMSIVTKLGQLKRTQLAASAYIESIEAFHTYGNPHLAKQYYQLLTAQRHYALPTNDNHYVNKPDKKENLGDPDYRNLLYLEYRLDVCLRENQLETFRAMLANPNAVEQLEMGGGKSTLLIFLLAEFKANGQNLVTLILPDALYESNILEIESRNRRLFKQPFYCFKFHRETDLSLETLGTLYKELLETIDQKGFVITTKEYKLSFLNTFKQMEYEIAEEIKTQEEDELSEDLLHKLDQFRLLCKIGYLMKTREQAIGDEIDLVSDVRHEVNFAIGGKESIDDLKLNLGKDLMEICITSKNPVIEELFENIISNSQSSFPAEKRHQAFKALAEIKLSQFENQNDLNLFGTREEWVDFVSNTKYVISDEKKTSLLRLKASNLELYQNISSLRGFLTTGFETALTKSCDVNYGKDPISNKFTIPYKASNSPSVKSEFDDEITRISYTLLNYIYKGFSKELISEYIEKSRQIALSQKSLDPEDYLSLADTPAAKSFAEFIRQVDPENEHGIRADLKYYDNDVKVNFLLNHINSNSKVKLNLCRNLVLKEMRSLNSQIKSNSMDLSSLSQSYGGFTGTPWNLSSFSDDMIAILKGGVDGKTWQTLLSRPIDIIVGTHQADDPISMILNESDFVKKNFQVLIDTGAYLRGKNNREFIEAALAQGLEKGIPLENGVYYNEAGQIVCLQQGSKTPVALSSAPATNLKYRVNLYDQPHCTGADLPNYSHAKALVTISDDNFIRDIFQGVWRLRGLKEGQDITFFMSDKVRDLILDGKKEKITKNHILAYASKIQGLTVKEDTWCAEKDKMKGAPVRMMNEILMEMGANDNISNTALLKTIGTFGKHVVHTRTASDMYDSYAQVPTLVKIKSAYREMNHEARKKIKLVHQELTGKWGDEEADVLSHVSKKMKLTQQTLKDRPLRYKDRQFDQVPVNDKATSQPGTEVQIKTETAVQIAVQVAVETKCENKFSVEIGDYNPVIAETYLSYKDKDIVDFIVQSTSNHFHAISHYLTHFDTQLSFSENYQNIYRLKYDTYLKETLLLPYRKPVRKLVAVKVKDQPMKMVIATDHEIMLHIKPFMNQRREGCGFKGLVVSINPTGPLIIDRIGENLGEDRAEFINLYVQAKFYDGQTHYTKEEKAALKTWLEQTDVSATRQFFEDFLLQQRPHQSRYPNSVLRKLFDAIEKEQSENEGFDAEAMAVININHSPLKSKVVDEGSSLEIGFEKLATSLLEKASSALQTLFTW